MFHTKQGFRLEFEFEDNDFFTNKVLTKDYYYSDKVDIFEPLQHEGLIVNRAAGCKIDWKSPEKDVTQRKVTKKMKHKSDNQVKTIEKLEKCDSFFNFFEPNSMYFWTFLFIACVAFGSLIIVILRNFFL